MAKNANLHSAKNAKKDEFYTQLADIENELKHYESHFKDKVVYCNCDDPLASNFFKYYNDAQIIDNAEVSGNARLFDSVIVANNAIVTDNAQLFDSASLAKRDKIASNAKHYDNFVGGVAI